MGTALHLHHVGSGARGHKVSAKVLNETFAQLGGGKLRHLGHARHTERSFCGS